MSCVGTFYSLLSWSMYWKKLKSCCHANPLPPPLHPHLILLVYCMQSLDLLGGGGGGGDTWGKWKYQAGCGEVGVTSTLCSTCQFAALRNRLCTRWQFCRCQCQIAMFPAVQQMAVLVVTVSACCVPCSAPDGSSGGDSVGLQCTRWQFWWWQCRPAVFSAVHLEGSAPDGSSVSASVSIPCSLQCIWKAQHRMAVLSVPVSAFRVLCSASGRLSTGWQFCQCQCQHLVFSAVHLALLLVPSCHFWFSKRLVSDTSHRTVLLQCSLGFCAIKNKNEMKQKDQGVNHLYFSKRGMWLPVHRRVHNQCLHWKSCCP